MKIGQNFIDSHGTGSNYPKICMHYAIHIFVTVQNKQATVKHIGLCVCRSLVSKEQCCVGLYCMHK